MKFIFSLSLILVVLSSCKDKVKPLNEDFIAIGYEGRGHEIILNDSLCFEVPKLKFILFVYHDSIFQVEIDQQDKQHYSLLKGNNRTTDSLTSLLMRFRKTTLEKQLKHIQEHGMPHGCYTDGYFLFEKNDLIQFGLFDFTNYYDWRSHYTSKEVILKPEQFPKIYQTIYHIFNSKWRDYYMSNEYHYKELRTHYSRILKTKKS